MTISREDFAEFFAEVNHGCEPFRWQLRLLDHLLDEGRWPDNVSAPTGSGKSNVVDVHVFANALYAAGAGPRVPRRLSVVVNRRAIVDQHLERARQLQTALDSRHGPVCREVSDVLAVVDPRKPLQVVSIRGGAPTDRSWLDDPRRCAVIAATPDMWGSRILFNGYGSGRHARPREAGFLAYDNVLVLDEAHLNRQLLDTARSIASIVDDHTLGSVPGLQVVGTTATPGLMTGSSVGVEQADLDSDPGGSLAKRLTNPKLVRAAFELPTRAKPPARASAIAREAAAMHERVCAGPPDAASRTVLCVVNNVETAVSTAKALRDTTVKERIVTWVGPMRPMDLDDAKARHPGLFSTKGAQDIDFLVATQTVEVGVDIDCAGLVTELAPGSALAQRFGRVNRLGTRDRAEIVVVAPADAPVDDAPPYQLADLSAAHTWLGGLGDGADVCPWKLAGSPPPAQRLKRHLCELTLAEVDWLAKTSAESFWPVDLNFFLRDDLESEQATVELVARRGLPPEDDVAMALLRVTPIVADETFSIPMRVGRAVLERVLTSDENPRAFVLRDGEIRTLRSDGSVGESMHAGIRPGDVVIVDAGHPLTVAGVVTAEAPHTTERLRARWDPTVERSDEERPDGTIEVLAPPDASGDRAQGPMLRLADEVLAETPDVTVEQLAERLGLGQGEQLFLPPPGMRVDDRLPWIVVVSGDIPADDPEARQSWSPGGGFVTLEQHQTAVAARARLLAISIGLDGFADAMDFAGAHHDDGKADPRFQLCALGARGEPLMAKSRVRSRQQVQRDGSRGGLPSGWRHEQLSAAYIVSELEAGPARDLAARLAGTSHGRGRPFFPHGVATLRPLDLDDAALDSAIDELFATGAGWDDIVKVTHRRYGHWGCAFLEAVFRAADCQVSREGS